MSDVLVRQWGPNCYAAYVMGNGPYPDFIGTADTREAAALLPGSVGTQEDQSGESEVSERAFGGEWSEQRDGPRNSTTPARLAPVAPGASL